MLGLGHGEAAVDELLGDGVKFANHGRIRAAAGEADHAAPVVRLQAGDLRPDPVFVFGLGQGVEIEDGLPGW